jgi:hypothetical protein
VGAHYGDGFELSQKAWWMRAVLHGSGAARNATYPRRNSGGACEIRPAKFGHPVQNSDANLGLRFLVFEAARLELVPDYGFPTADPLPGSACVACMRGCVSMRLR